MHSLHAKQLFDSNSGKFLAYINQFMKCLHIRKYSRTSPSLLFGKKVDESICGSVFLNVGGRGDRPPPSVATGELKIIYHL